MLTLLSTLTLGLPVAKEPMALDAKVEAQGPSYANSCGWSYNPHAYSNTMTSTNVVKMDGQAVSTTGGALGAFVGNTCHGISTGKAGPPFGPVRCAAPNTFRRPNDRPAHTSFSRCFFPVRSMPARRCI